MGRSAASNGDMAAVERVAGVEILNPGRVMYPNMGFTKRDLVHYYASVAPVMLPHLRDRPVTLKRYPDTTTGPVFYEKDVPSFAPDWVKTFGVWRRSGESQIHYVVVNDLRTLVWAASVGTIEFHPFLARAPEINSPTELVFDLDPGAGVDVIACARVAILVRDFLARFGLEAFAKVSGSAGLQVYVPLNTRTSYAVTQAFAKAVAEFMHDENPGLVVSDMQRAERKGKVFIDWSQNADFKSTVAVYSVRAKRHRPFVSLPVTWDELAEAVEAGDSSLLYFLAQGAVSRVEARGDLFAPVLRLQQAIPETFVRELGITKHAEAAPRPSRRAVRSRELPRASAQGGRRRFLLRSSPKKRGSVDLAVELPSQAAHQWVCWTVANGRRSRAKQVATEADICISDEEFDSLLREAQATRASDSDRELGTYELIEGSFEKGYVHLYFNGRRMNGHLVLMRETDDSKKWILSRIPSMITWSGNALEKRPKAA